MSIGMIFGGMAEGLGAGLMAAGKSAETAALAAQKSEANLNAQLQVLEAKRAASMEVLMAKLEAKGATGEGGGKAQPFSEALMNETAAYETGSTGAEVARRRAIARGEAPMVDIPGKDIPAAGAVDTAAVGENGEDYSDAMTRRLQHAAAKPTVIGREVDQAAMDDYKKHAAQMGSSIRRSANPKESKNMAEAGLLDQRSGLVRQAVDKGIVGPGEGALLSDGKAAYNKEVSLATGKSTDVGRSEIVKNEGAAAKDKADANDKSEGGIKPKDQKDWLDNERKSIDTERADIRKREAELADIVKSATLTDEEKKAAKAQLATERAAVNVREQNWRALSEKVGANILGANVKGASPKATGMIGSRAYGGANVDTDATTERRYVLERELEEERAKPLEGAYTQAKKDAAIAGLERNLADLKGGGMAKVDTSRMGNQPFVPAAMGPQTAAPAAPAAAKPGAYKSAAEVKAAYQAGQLTKDQARAALQPFGFK